jgi:hypothetical protein
MATAYRKSVTDFMAAVSSRGVNAGTSSNVYSCALNADGSVQISKNGVVIFSAVRWPGTGSCAQTDAGGANQDSVDILDSGSQNFNVGSAQAFINSLT